MSATIWGDDSLHLKDKAPGHRRGISVHQKTSQGQLDMVGKKQGRLALNMDMALLVFVRQTCPPPTCFSSTPGKVLCISHLLGLAGQEKGR